MFEKTACQSELKQMIYASFKRFTKTGFGPKKWFWFQTSVLVFRPDLPGPDGPKPGLPETRIKPIFKPGTGTGSIYSGSNGFGSDPVFRF